MNISWRKIGLSLLLAGSGLVSERPNRAEDSKSGYQYHRDEVPDVPWSIQVLKIDRSNSNLVFDTTFGNGKAIGLVPLPQQLQTIPSEWGRAVAAINGDYYQNKDPFKGDPKGIQISHGELISAPCNWTCFWVDANGQPNMTQVASKFTVTWPDGSSTPFGLNEALTPAKCVLYTEAIGESTSTSGAVELILEKAASVSKWLPFEVCEEYAVVVREIREGGNASVAPNKMILSIGSKLRRSLPKLQKGALLRLNTATEPSVKGAQTAISGGPALIKDGKIQVGWSAVRHPRTALGWNKDSIFFVQVDGRQSGYSVGMTYSELATYMQKIGCEQAMNLDGGGSATFWMLGQVVNSPSEGQARAVANGLVLLQKPPDTTVSHSITSAKAKVEED